MEATQPAGAGVDFPAPEDKDFDEDIGEEERKHYVAKYKDLNSVRNTRLHCTACDRHLGCAAKGDGRMRPHPMLRTLVCRACHTFYNSGEFERGDDGSELYCRWCGQGGQVYCCSACPHVFCAKCIKRNMGPAKIREIESIDDWKCFKCVPQGLWDLRATCWALLRYCDLKNRQAYLTEDAGLKEKYQKECAIDYSECCKNKKRVSITSRKKEEKIEKKEEKAVKVETDDKKSLPLTVKFPSSIQVKKFATVSVDSILKAGEKKGIKRPGSPMMRPKPMVIRAPIPIAPYPRTIAPMVQLPVSPAPRMPQPKRMKVNQGSMAGAPEANMRKYNRASRPRYPAIQYPTMSVGPPHNNAAYNGFSSYYNADNINLSIESLTQGLDMASVAGMSHAATTGSAIPGPSGTFPPAGPSGVLNSAGHSSALGSAGSSSLLRAACTDNELVCTPDFPMEPLCEVTEEPVDDDVECITPGPIAPPKPPLMPHRSLRPLPDLSAENIVQMTENDVTVNAHTGGLKFRVDPQTLSSNKMYRLPDGRIFAINSNPSMPGGYSATIVAVSETGTGGTPTPAPLRGATYAANLSAVVASPPPLAKLTRKSRRSSVGRRPAPSQASPTNKPAAAASASRNLDMKTPIEWYRYNLIDAVDALEYSLSKLNRLKKEADSRHLRTRTVDEMRSLHRTLERHLHTSASRFREVRDNLNRGFKAYLKKKGNEVSDDDDVEILPDSPSKTGGDGDDPIFIDENSIESSPDFGDNPDGSDREITALSSEHNDSGDLTASTPTDLPDPLAVMVKESNESDINIKEPNESDFNIKESNEKESNGNKTNEKDSNEEESNKKQPIIEDSNKKQPSEEDSNKKQPSEEDSNIKQPSEEDSNENKSIETESNEKESNQQTTDQESSTEKENDKGLPDKNTDENISPESEIKSESLLDIKEKENSTHSIKSDNDQAQTMKDVIQQEHTKKDDLKDASDDMVIEECNVLNKELNSEVVDDSIKVTKDETDESQFAGNVTSQNKESEYDDSIPEGLIPEVDFSEGESKLEIMNKLNGSSCGDQMEVDIANGQGGELRKNADSDLQMSDEMIENLLADDGTTDDITADEITADLQTFSHSLDSLTNKDLVNSEFN